MDTIAKTTNTMRFARRGLALGTAAVGFVALTGCHLDMWIQPKIKPMDKSDFFANGQSARPLLAHTVARGHLRLDDGYYLGIENGKLLEAFPFPVTKEVLHRGQERFNIFCSPCHGQLGDGKGMIARRGLALRRQPADYHTDRLRKMPVGHFYDVITNGFGIMYPYASRIEPEDRWKIVAYIRALQRSQDAKPGDIPPDKVQEMDNPVVKQDAAGGEKE